MTAAQPPPLKITCTSSDCEEGFHCFRATREMLKENRAGACRSCGVELVDWDRVHDQDLTDVFHTFQALRYELIRHHFWHVPLDQRAINHALRKGRIRMAAAARSRIASSVGPETPFRDGAQTPRTGNLLYYGQHATASCCRKCIEYWHGIPVGRELTETEVEYLAQLVTLYVNERLPDLADEPIKVPPIRRSKGRGK